MQSATVPATAGAATLVPEPPAKALSVLLSRKVLATQTPTAATVRAASDGSVAKLLKKAGVSSRWFAKSVAVGPVPVHGVFGPRPPGFPSVSAIADTVST